MAKTPNKAAGSLAEFKKNERKKLKIFSKIVYIAAKIAKYLSVIIFILAGVLNYGMRGMYWNYVVSDFPNYFENSRLTLWDFFQYGGVAKSILIIAIMTSFIVTEIYVFKLILEIERLFKRINKSASPFSLENIQSLKKIVKYIIVSQLLPTLTNLLVKIIMPENIVRINLPGLSLALIVIVLVYIFQYGYLLEKEKQKIEKEATH